MLRNYLTITLRNLRRQKLYTGINIFGLALGIGCCLLILAYVYHEILWDRFHDRSDLIHRVVRDAQIGGEQRLLASMPVPLGPTIEAEIPQIRRAVRIRQDEAILRVGAESETVTLHFADDGFFDIFSFPLKSGNPETVLGEPANVVLSADAAQRHFGGGDVMGATLTFAAGDYSFDAVVAGIAEPAPSNSTISFDFLLPISRLESFHASFSRPHWFGGASHLYVRLAEHSSAEEIESMIAAVEERHVPDSPHIPPSTTLLQPLTEVHWTPGVVGSFAPTNRKENVFVLAAIALVILLIACINYTLLSVGYSVHRVREVGIRKVMGANRRMIIKQFWGEALVITIMALLIAVVLMTASVPSFSNLLGRQISFEAAPVTVVLAALTGFLVLVTIAAGSYPAVYLSRFSPAHVLRSIGGGTGKRRFSQILITTQFTVSIVLIVSTLLMARQINYMTSRELGYDHENVITIDLGTQFREGDRLLSLMRNELGGRPDILNITASWEQVGRTSEQAAINYLPARHKGSEHRVHSITVANGYLQTLGIELISGRDLREHLETDRTHSILVNESLARTFGMDHPIGEEIWFHRWQDTRQVVGVVRDFHALSLHDEIRPLIIQLSDDGVYQSIYVRTSSDDIHATLHAIEAAWRATAPDLPFAYSFLDETIQTAYDGERRWSRILAFSSLFAILIACMGLFGLATLTVNRRTKEIGIRKVLGATVTSVVTLLSKEFAKLVLIATVIAAPIGYYVMSRWLEDFAYRIEISWWIFILAGGIALAIALLTVSSQAVKAAVRNPVEALRYE